MPVTYTKEDLDAAYQRGVTTSEKLWQRTLYSLLDEGMVKVHCLQCQRCNSRFTFDPQREYPSPLLCPKCIRHDSRSIGVLVEVKHDVSVTRREVDTITRALSSLVQPLRILRDAIATSPATQGLTLAQAQSLSSFREAMTALNRIEELLASGWQNYDSASKLDQLPALNELTAPLEAHDPTKAEPGVD